MSPQLVMFFVGVLMIVVGLVLGGSTVFSAIRLFLGLSRAATTEAVSDDAAATAKAKDGCLTGGIAGVVGILLANLGALVVVGSLIWAAISYLTR